MSAHSPEPWRTHVQREEGLGTIRDAAGTVVCRVSPPAITYYPDTERRIVAAVNSVAGLSTEALEAGGVQRLCEMVEALLARGDFWKRPDLVGFVPGELDDVADALRALGRLT